MLLQKLKSTRSKPSSEIPYRNGRIRFFVLFLVSVVLFANLYSFNNPQALQDSIMKQLQITQTQFNMLYTIIALPNLFFPFFIGFFIDYMGIRIALVGLTLAVMIFQTVVALGGVHKSFQAMLIGRMFFGIAFVGLSVAQVSIVSYWFLGKQLAFSIGLATTLPELGNALNSLITPIVYDSTKKLGPPLFISVGICFISFCCACIAVYIDKKADQYDIQHNLRVVTDSQDTYVEHKPQGIKLKDLKQLRIVYWLIISICMLAIAQYIPFLDNINKLIQVRFCFSQVSAGKNVMVTYLVSALLGFPLGILVDKMGYKRYLIMAGMGVFMIAHLIVFVYRQCDEDAGEPVWSGASWGLFLLGFAYCFYANCILPAVPIVVSKKITGTAFGILQVFQNFAMALCPVISGQIVELSITKQQGYKYVSLFFMILGIVGLCLSFLLFLLSNNDKKILDGTSTIKKIWAVQINPTFSDGQFMQQKRVEQISMNSLQQRLIRTYDYIQFVQEKQVIKPEKIIQFEL